MLRPWQQTYFDAINLIQVLDERKSAILAAVISEYIETAQPVGSSAVAGSTKMKVSAATVRNEMAALESEGLLCQPHTSAGRIPTQLGYREFVDSLNESDLLPTMDSSIQNVFGRMRGEIEEVMSETASILADMTDYAAVVVDETDEAANVRSVQLVALSEKTLMAVVVLANGQIVKHSLDLREAAKSGSIEEASRLLQECLDQKLISEAPPVRSSSDATAFRIAKELRAALLSSPSESEKVYVDGKAKVVDSFGLFESVGQVLTLLEQQLVVVSLLADVVERGQTVAIGTETGVDPLTNCSVVVAPYEIDGEHGGSIAVLGPTRMNYPQAMSAVSAVSKQLGNLLSEG